MSRAAPQLARGCCVGYLHPRGRDRAPQYMDIALTAMRAGCHPLSYVRSYPAKRLIMYGFIMTRMLHAGQNLKHASLQLDTRELMQKHTGVDGRCVTRILPDLLSLTCASAHDRMLHSMHATTSTCLPMCHS